MSTGLQEKSECEKFPGRLRDLCEGRGREGRPKPLQYAVDAFRLKHGLPPLPALSGTFRFPSSQLQPKPPAEPRPKKMMRWPQYDPSEPPPASVGTKLKEIFATLGVQAQGCGGCMATIMAMDAAGVEGCRARRDEFIAEIKQRAIGMTITQKFKAAALGVMNGIYANPLDPVPDLYDLAIQRMESNS